MSYSVNPLNPMKRILCNTDLSALKIDNTMNLHMI